ncbi:hypothetical protein, partial [Methylobacterium aquaticum]|uniref:hypothetical protein n=1 Tax=Methylobacterium aquaticum TaxID=270351 RepID=UPI003CCA5A90
MLTAAENDLFCARGQAIPIASRDSPTQITLKQPWPLASLVGEPAFNILSLGEYWRSAISINKRFADLLAKWEVVSPFRFDASGTLAERDNYNNQPRGFVYVAVDPLPIRIFIKLANTNSAFDWSAAIYIGSGGQVEFQEALDQERQQRIQADAALGQRIDTLAAGADPNVRSDLNAEIARSTGKDAQHDSQIAGLRTDLTAETSGRMSADTALGGRIDNETSARIGADNALGGRVDTEINARLAADANLGTRITAEESRATTAEAAEASARRAADDVHDARLGTIDTERATTFNLASLRLLGPALADGDDAPYAGAIVSTLGRLFLGALRDGTIEIPRLFSANPAQLGGLVLRRSPADGDDDPYVEALVTTLGRAVLGVLADGAVEIPRLSSSGIRLTGSRPVDGDDNPYVEAFTSSLGRVLLGFLADGAVEIPRLFSRGQASLGGLTLTGLAPEAGDDLPYVDAIVSTLGRLFLGITSQGVEIPCLEQPAVAAPDGDAPSFEWAIRRGSRVALGLERDGLYLRLSARGARDVGARLTPDPALFRGDHRPFNLRYGPAGTLIGTRQDADRTVYDIRQIEGGLYDTAVVSDSRPLPIRAYFGQSQAGGGGGDLAVITGAAYPRHVLAPAVYGKAFGGAVANGYLINDLVPLFDGQGGQQFINTLFGLYLERQNRDAGPAGPGVIAPTSTFGGQPLSAFAKGQTPYTNLMAILTACPPLAARYGRRSYTDAIVIVHGEAGPYGRSTYATPLGTLIDNLRADVQIINAAVGFNVPPQIFLTQQNQFDSNNVPTNTGVKLAQLDVAKSRLGQGVTMLGPMYQTQVQSDGIHMDNAGKALQAELHAHVVRRVLDDGVVGWNPLWPVSLANLPRSGAVITLDLVLPPGLASIAQDTDWVLAPADGK